MKRRTVQTYRAAGRRDALLPAPGSVANRSQWTHNWETRLPFWGAQEGIAPRAGRQLLRARRLPGRPDGRRRCCSSSLTPSPPAETGPRPYLAPQQDRSRGRRLREALRGSPQEAAGLREGLGPRPPSPLGRCVLHCRRPSVCPSSTNVRARSGLGGGGGGVGKGGGARSMRGAAGGRPGLRPPRRAPPGFCLDSPRTDAEALLLRVPVRMLPGFWSQWSIHRSPPRGQEGQHWALRPSSHQPLHLPTPAPSPRPTLQGS